MSSEVPGTAREVALAFALSRAQLWLVYLECQNGRERAPLVNVATLTTLGLHFVVCSALKARVELLANFRQAWGKLEGVSREMAQPNKRRSEWEARESIWLLERSFKRVAKKKKQEECLCWILRRPNRKWPLINGCSSERQLWLMYRLFSLLARRRREKKTLPSGPFKSATCFRSCFLSENVSEATKFFSLNGRISLRPSHRCD